jgi:hypothetical protein
MRWSSAAASRPCAGRLRQAGAITEDSGNRRFARRERFADAHTGATECDDQAAHAVAVGAVDRAAHDREDLLDRWCVRG